MLTSFPAMALRKLPEEDLRGMDIALAGAAKHRAISPSFYATLDACRLTVDRTDSTKT